VGFLKRLLGVAGEASGTDGFSHGRMVRPGVPEDKWRGHGDAHRGGGSSSTKRRRRLGSVVTESSTHGGGWGKLR
jgi:hypothetical protein